MSMNTKTPAENKAEFLRIVAENIHREGIESLIKWLETTTFFRDPASTRYHGSYEGGLCEHSLNVYRRLRYEMQAEKLFRGEVVTLTPEEEESIAIAALFHDLCKVGTYRETTRNVKDANGRWQSVPCYEYKEGTLSGHGALSLFYVGQHLRLTEAEGMAILWHMSVWSNNADSNAVSTAYKNHLLAFCLHKADEDATFIDEVD